MTSQEVRKLWTEALRSGNYKQGVGRLEKMYNNDFYYCCLGVLCDLYCKNVKDIRTFEQGSYINVRYSGEAFGLPPEVKKWAELNWKEEDTLIDLNDNKVTDFSDIANYIENLD